MNLKIQRQYKPATAHVFLFVALAGLCASLLFLGWRAGDAAQNLSPPAEDGIRSSRIPPTMGKKRVGTETNAADTETQAIISLSNSKDAPRLKDVSATIYQSLAEYAKLKQRYSVLEKELIEARPDLSLSVKIANSTPPLPISEATKSKISAYRDSRPDGLRILESINETLEGEAIASLIEYDGDVKLLLADLFSQSYFPEECEKLLGNADQMAGLTVMTITPGTPEEWLSLIKDRIPYYIKARNVIAREYDVPNDVIEGLKLIKIQRRRKFLAIYHRDSFLADELMKITEEMKQIKRQIVQIGQNGYALPPDAAQILTNTHFRLVSF